MENKIKLASANTITQTSDTVESLSQIMADALLESVSFQRFTLVPATRDKFRMWTGTLSNAIQAYSGTPAESGTATVSDEEFTLIKKSVNHLVLYDAFKDTEFNLSISNLKSEGLPAAFEEFLASELGKQAQKLAEDEIWNGNGSQTGDPVTGDGFAALIKTNVPAGQQGTSGTLNPTVVADVDDFLAALVALATDDMVGNKSKFKIFMNQKVNDAWYAHLAAQAATNIPQNTALKYLNWDIEIVPNLSNRRVIIGNPEHMAIGMGVEGDLVDLQVVDQYAQGTGINGARVTGNWGYAAGIAATDFAIYEFTA